jgi:hypothetical protein
MFIFGATAGQSNPVVYTSDTFEVWANQVSLVLDKIVNRPSEANHAFTAARTFFRCASGSATQCAEELPRNSYRSLPE